MISNTCVNHRSFLWGPPTTLTPNKSPPTPPSTLPPLSHQGLLFPCDGALLLLLLASERLHGCDMLMTGFNIVKEAEEVQIQ